MQSMVTCPKCGGEVTGKRPGLPVLVCGNCQSILAINADQLKPAGEAGRMPFDVSPLQLGSLLVVEGTRGEVVGRERWRWERGFWNEWLLQFPDGSVRWVAEEAGLYMVMEEVEASAEELQFFRQVESEGRDALGRSIGFRGEDYTISDIKTVRCVASEGAQLQIIPAEFARSSIDFRSANKSALTWQNDSKSPSLWQGRYCTLEDLEPARLRRFDGWARPNFENHSEASA